MKSIKQVQCIILMVMVAFAMFLAGCQSEDNNESGETGFARSKTLYLAGSQWGDPNTFNPLSESWQAAWPVNGNFNLMYEPLLVYNSLTGVIEPLLATLDSADSDTISVILNPAAKWSDGKPLTSKDVVFTYELGKKYEGSPTTYLWDFISDIKVEALTDSAGASLGERISFAVNKENRNNPLVVMDLLLAIRIVPAHIFEAKLAAANDDFGTVQKEKVDSNPVVSGPYNLLTYSNEKIIIKRRDDYWGNAALHGGKMPAPEFIIHPIYKSNDAFSIALQQGNLDASQTFIPRIWLKKKSGVHTWHEKEPYFMPGAIPMLYINSTKKPLNDKQFRKAMAHAINYQNVAELAVSGYSPDMKPGIILPFGVEGQYYNDEDAQKYGTLYNLDAAKKVLADAGYKSVMKADGTLDHMVDKNGEKVPTIFIKSPAGWSDWEAMVKIAVKGMREAGIDAREGFCDAGQYWQSQPTGDFDLIMMKPAATVTPSLPWARFESVMSSRNWKPVGDKMNENQGRFNQPGTPEYIPEIDELLKNIPLMTDEAELAEAYRKLNVYFMQEQPALPLSFLPEQFYEFSDANWTNWPTEANPYAPPQLPWGAAASKILWELKSTKK